MKKSRKNPLLSLFVFVALGQCALAQNTLWQGAIDNDFNTAGNWNNGVPGAGDIATVRSGANPVLSGAASMGHMRIGQLSGNGGTSILTLGTGSALTTTNRTDVGFSLSGDASSSSGAMTVNGGTHNLGTLYVGNVAGTDNTVNASGTTTINGGTVNLSNGGYIAARSGATSTGASTGSLIIRGGSLTAAGATFQLGQRGSGTLSLEGGGATFSNGLRLADGGSSSATLNLMSGTLDVAGGFFTKGSGTVAINMGGGDLLLNGDRTGLLGTWLSDPNVTFTISGGLVAGSAEENAFSGQYAQNLGQTTDSNGNKFSYGYDGTTDTTRVWSVVPVPEPSTYALFGGMLALICVMCRHRNKRW